ncbi:UNVERIFIED_CONTAM: hypothetical protein FKN15_073752 [Acipenser sinensis]
MEGIIVCGGQYRDSLGDIRGAVDVVRVTEYWTGLSALVATSWYGHRIAQDFYNPFTPTNTKYEFGVALFIGWGAAALCILGGAFLCSSSCSKGGQAGSRQYPKTRAMPSGGKDYV